MRAVAAFPARCAAGARVSGGGDARTKDGGAPPRCYKEAMLTLLGIVVGTVVVVALVLRHAQMLLCEEDEPG